MSKIIHYSLQDELPRENYVFALQPPPPEITLQTILDTFPIPGRFHFRFKTHLQAINNVGWVDVTNASAKVPLYNGHVFLKALQLPPFSNTNLRRPNKKRLKEDTVDIIGPVRQAVPSSAGPQPHSNGSAKNGTQATNQAYAPPQNAARSAPTQGSNVATTQGLAQTAPNQQAPAFPPKPGRPQSQDTQPPAFPPKPGRPQSTQQRPAEFPPKPSQQRTAEFPPKPQRQAPEFPPKLQKASSDFPAKPVRQQAPDFPPKATQAQPAFEVPEFPPKSTSTSAQQSLIPDFEAPVMQSAPLPRANPGPQAPKQRIIPDDPTRGLTREELKREKEDAVRKAEMEARNRTLNKFQEDSKAASDRIQLDASALGAKWDAWESRNMQKNNVRTLLATIQDVMWEGANWTRVSPATLLDSASVKRQYKRCILKFHPDKHQHSTPEIKYIAQRVFHAINEALKDLE